MGIPDIPRPSEVLRELANEHSSLRKELEDVVGRKFFTGVFVASFIGEVIKEFVLMVEPHIHLLSSKGPHIHINGHRLYYLIVYLLIASGGLVASLRWKEFVDTLEEKAEEASETIEEVENKADSENNKGG